MTIIGAAETVITHQSGELYRRYGRWREEGQSYKNARRNVARDIAARRSAGRCGSMAGGYGMSG